MEPQPTKKSTLKIVLITLAVLVGIVIIIGAIGAFSVMRTIKNFSAEDRPQLISQVDTFINNINEGSFDAAYAATDIEGGMTPEKFKEEMTKLQPVVKGYVRQESEFRNMKITNSNGYKKSVAYQTKVYFSDNTEGVLSVIAVKKDNTWIITNFYITADPAHINKES